jgi:hypothetical protein
MPQTDPDTDRRLSQATDHLVNLPRMSTTAGVGVQEYVAINNTAVIALLLGLASLLAIIDWVLLAVPLLGAVTAFAALGQIRRSNGTQTGRNIAMAGLFLSVGMGSFVLSSSAIQWLGRRTDSQAISQLCVQFGDDMKLGRYDSAYQLCSQRFQTRVDREEFVSRLQLIQDQLSSGTLGKIVGAHWNGLAQWNSDPDSGSVTAWAYVEINFEHVPNPDDKAFQFRKSGTRWFIDGIEFFPPKKSTDKPTS